MAQCERCNNLLETSLFTPNPRSNLIIIAHHFPNLILILIRKLHLILNRDPLKNHLILGQRPGLVRQNIPNPTKLLRHRRVSSYASLNQLVIVDVVGVEKFGEV